MKLRIIILLLVISSFNQLMAQKTDSILPKLSLERIALINQNDTYITFPTDIGNIAPLIFEANVNPSFIIRERKDSKLMAVLTPQIILRMFNEDSFPNRTPSYIPQISFYYLANKKAALNYSVLFGRIAHHSNGQEGEFYKADNTINTKSGSFATNFMELGFLKTSYSTKLKAIKTIKSSVEFHPKSWMIQEMRGEYSGLRWHNSFTSFKFPLQDDENGKAKFSLKAETTLMLDNFNELNFFDIKRLNASLTFYYHPKFLEDIGLFVQLYRGTDYYNINFEHQMSIIRFGLMTEILRF